MSRAWIVILGSAFVLGSAAGSALVYIAIDHNPQGEFINYETGAVNYADLSVLFLSGFALARPTVGLVFGLFIAALYRLVRP